MTQETNNIDNYSSVIATGSNYCIANCIRNYTLFSYTTTVLIYSCDNEELTINHNYQKSTTTSKHINYFLDFIEGFAEFDRKEIVKEIKKHYNPDCHQFTVIKLQSKY